ncbi:phage tail protein [Aliivibrio fischeri]|uniref:phage tail protein n=1 Tax=Aliivibrio fischeri TaxID=668 RepID=UPI0012DA0FA1|nr:phage tail protein [Aliivibrio fischeri]MUK41004.1 phage tail protein [Aliivibrio fischeri]
MDKTTNHENDAPELPTENVPWWMDGKTIAETLKEPHFLAKGVMQYWQRLKGWLLYPLAQLDPMTCNERLLSLLAWDRDITRFKDEPTSLFRKRVKYAFVNATDAGEKAGFIRIFQRLGVGVVEVDERTPERDWDIITIRLSDSQLSENYSLLEQLLQQYGRTCRRYEYQVINVVQWTISATPLDWQQECSVAVLEE